MAFDFHKLLGAAAVAVGLGLLATPALALTEDVLELQLDSGEFAALIRQAVIDAAPCPQRLSCAGGQLGPDDPDGPSPCYIDHIDVPGVGDFRFADAPETIAVGVGDVVNDVHGVQFVQPIQVRAKSEDCVFDPDCAVNDYVRTIDTDLVLGVRLEVDPQTLADLDLDGPAICADLDDLEGGVTAQERALLLIGLSQPICQAVPTGSLAALVGDRQLARAGISLGSDLADLAFRFEFAADPATKPFDEPGWRGFLDGSLAPTVGDDGLGLMVQKHVLINTFAAELDLASDPDLNPDGPTTTRWLPHGHGGATLELMTPVEIVVPVCPDIDADVTTSMHFSFDRPARQLIVDLEVDFDLSFWDKTACGAMFGGAGGPFDWAMREGLLQILVNAFTPTMGEKLAESEAARAAGKEGKIPEECVATGDSTLRCRFDVGLRPISFGGMASGPQRVTGVFGHADGLILFGEFEAIGLAEPWFLETTEIPIQWGVSNSSCYSGGESEHFAGAIGLQGRGRLCEPPIEHDDQNVYWREAITSGNALPQEWIVHVADHLYGNGSDWQAPYDFEMTVFTTVGSQTIALDAPSYDDDAALAAHLALTIETEIACTTTAEQGLENLEGVDTPDSVINPWDQTLSPVEEVSVGATTTSVAPSYTTTTTTSTTRTTIGTRTGTSFSGSALLSGKTSTR